MQEGFLLTLDYFAIGHASNPHFRQEAANASPGFTENCCLRRSFHEECPLNHLTCTPPTRSSMFRIAFIIGLILTAFSLSVTASPLPQQPAGKKKVDDNYIKSAKQIIGRYDTNGDEKLSKQEWQKMLLNPAKADANQDQQITVDEYARWARSKDRSRKSKEVKPTQIKPTTALESPAQKSPAQKSPAQKKQIKPQPKVEPQNEPEVRRLRAQRLQAENQKNQERARQAEGKNGQDQSEQELIEQIERQLEQRDRRESEQRERREMEQRERREMEQNRRREMEHHATHGEKEDWEHEFRKLEEARALLHREQEEAARKFGDDHPRRRTIQKELDEIEGVMKQMFRERGEHVARHENREHENREHENREHENREHHEHDDHGRDDHESHQHEHDGHEDHGDHERHDHVDRDHEREMPIEERLELLRVAFDHLNDAGMHDLAEETKRRGEELERQLRERNAHGSDQIHRLIEESHRAIHAVNQRLDQVQRELQEMRDQFNRLRNQR
jgi:hypothetical protein